jgi:hypothetical protein
MKRLVLLNDMTYDRATSKNNQQAIQVEANGLSGGSELI